MAIIDSIREMVDLRMTKAQIAEEVGLSVARVSRVMRENGIHARRHSALDDISTEDKAKLVELYQAHSPVRRLLAELGLSYNHLYQLLEDANVELHIETSNRNRERQYDDAIRMYEEGYQLVEIIETTGLSQPQIHAEVHRRGIPLRNKRKHAQGR